MKRYTPKDIESKWQKTWEEQGIYNATEDPTKPKKYILEFFPYPSGAAMHVGHVRNYAIGDAISRFMRMQGHNVLHPMGWDAFGLPAENFAIKNKISPKVAIEQNTSRFKQQLTQMGFGYDWSREINSTDPDYYKWTQWFFLLLFKRGLAYQQESLQWWCPVDKTVLANEQVEAGKCWRCGNDVEKKALKQWFFKITDYADRLVKDLDDVDWSDGIKHMQRNWIGRSKGAEIDFAIDGHDHVLRIFTTRPDTLYGATFMVLAPEHPFVQQITSAEQEAAVGAYVKAAQAKSDIERQETDREKTGVFTGAYAINPVNNEKIPVWIADYVLYGYGTGAIMAVPAHDERDHEFSQKFDLPERLVYDPEFVRDDVKDKTEFIKKKKIVAIVENDKGQILTINWGKLGGRLTIGGTVEGDEAPETTALREVTEETGYTDLEVLATSEETVYYRYYAHSKQEAHDVDTKIVHLRLKSDARQEQNLDDSEKGNFKVEWVDKNVADTEITEPLHRYAFDKYILGKCYHGEGRLVNSDKFNGLTTDEAREKIVEDLAQKGVGEEKINYKMRDWLISRQRYWGAPIPIIHCEDHGAVAVPDDQLPVTLPDVESYEPSGDGRSPLANVPEFVNTTCPTCGKPAMRETDTMDGFACSSWYFLRFADPHNNDVPFTREKAEFWSPVDQYIGGAEHAVMHLLYARFWTKVMYDAGLITFQEPFTRLLNQGMILAPDGQKMSKSKGNTIEPDGLIEQGYGADSIRVMELFIGPWNQMANWSVEGLGGSHRFLQRIWTLVQETLEAGGGDSGDVKALQQSQHKTIKKVTEDLHDLGLNTAVAALMEYVNQLYKHKTTVSMQSTEWKQSLVTLVQLLAPFAPHISEELWQQLGQEGSVHTSEWPQWDDALLVSDTMKIVVQVNGKVRANIDVLADADEAMVLEAAKTDDKVASYLDGKEIKKAIYVPGRLVSFVV